MSNQEIELTAYCGLYCGDCIRYKSKAARLARDLVRELKKVEFDKYAEVKSLSMKEFQYYKQCYEALEAIAKLQCVSGCRLGEGYPTFSCKIIKCCQGKGFKGCWDCAEFEKCQEFEFLKPFHGDAPLQNLRKIRELGLGGWTEYRQKFYVWQ